MNNELLKQDLIEAYLEAYNRECKRVDELTEEVDKRVREIDALRKVMKDDARIHEIELREKQERIQELVEGLKRSTALIQHLRYGIDRHPQDGEVTQSYIETLILKHTKE